MGEARRRRLGTVSGPLGEPALPSQQAVITDIEDVGKLLAEEKIFCEQCAQEFPLWPPEIFIEHSAVVHQAALWPADAQIWKNYRDDTDIARRANFITKLRVQFVSTILRRRCDLYMRLVEAGVIVAPGQG